MSALGDAIDRSFHTGDTSPPAVSPMSALRRRQMTGWEVAAQSVATTAPAASMVMLPVALAQLGSPLAGLFVIAGAALAITLVAVCIAQFTRRQAAAGGLYSFVFQGLGTRAALTAAVAVTLKYLGSAALTLYGGAAALSTVLAGCGLDVRGVGPQLAVHLVVAAMALTVLVRGARVAALAILGVEVCSLVFVLVVLLGSAPGTVPVPAPAPVGGHGLATVALIAVFSLAGFESATFFGPEARRPLVTVTRVVLLTPLVCGALLVVAAWATWTGRAATLLQAYLYGTASGVPAGLVVALHLGLACSFLASATASSHAASRVLFSLGVEHLVPRGMAAVHSRFRTPHRALAAIMLGVMVVALLLGLGGSALVPWTVELRHVVRAAVVVAYVLLAVAAVGFLLRIREQTVPALLAGGVAALAGTALLGHHVAATAAGALGAPQVTALVAVAAMLGSGIAWRARLARQRPTVLARVGTFDRAGSEDLLPGAGAFAPDQDGNPVLVARRAPP